MRSNLIVQPSLTEAAINRTRQRIDVLNRRRYGFRERPTAFSAVREIENEKVILDTLNRVLRASQTA